MATLRRNVIVLGASAGGIEATMRLVRGLPADLPASLLVVIHISPHHRSVLPRMLESAGALPAHHARDGELLHQGRIYVAPPDHHLVVSDEHLRLLRGPRENGARPAVDALFRSAARSLGPRVIGVILSGALDDGTAGLAAIKRHGGLAVVQDPDEAFCADMPRHALAAVPVDHCLSIDEMPELLARLSRQAVPRRSNGARSRADEELRIALGDQQPLLRGDPSTFSCPTCGGVLMELHDGDVLHFRCQVGHAFGPDALRTEQEESLENALWAALRALEEKAMLAHRMAVRARELKQLKTAERFGDRAESAEHQARLVRQALQHAQAEPSEPAPLADHRSRPAKRGLSEEGRRPRPRKQPRRGRRA